MTEKQQIAAAKHFSEKWQDKGYEKGESQPFWIELLEKVYGIEEPAHFIRFEEQVKLDKTNFIDGHIPTTKVLIEQKGKHVNLRKAIKQSDGSLLTPFQQALRYASNLSYSERPRWIVTCNFQSFLVYDLEYPNAEPQEILLENLHKEYYRLNFLTNSNCENIRKEQEVSIKAGEIIGEIYDALLTLYGDSEPETLRALNILCVRIVFCLYAEDAQIFQHDQFYNYLRQYEADDMREQLLQLFKVLNTPEEQRSRFLKDELKAFPYTNGGLFAEEIEIPLFTPELTEKLLEKASLDFDWSEISPTIFGALFESTLNPVTRRSGGMHYTSIENIHKVIDPLFLDDLRQELDKILAIPTQKKREKSLHEYQDKLSSLRFLDPACGSGNFLTETFISLRRLENRAIEALYADGVKLLGIFVNPVQVNINQFYGIEINDFAVTVATTALWISEAQMLRETERIIEQDVDFLPLKSNYNIHEGNALRMDWNDIIPAQDISYIMGNPPFVGARKMEQNGSQKQDVLDIFGKIKDVQDLDYVACWYKKAATYIQGTSIKAAFVSTNSICQGSQVPILWKEMFNLKIHINYAYQTFRWDSEATEKAAVHCIIVGFSLCNSASKRIYKDLKQFQEVDNISPYLVEGPDKFITAEKNPICEVPKMNFGNQPRDGGHFVISPEEYEEIINSKDSAKDWLRPYIGSAEFIQGKERWCLWLKKASPLDIAKSKILLGKVEAVREFRLASTAKTTNGYAKVPHLFAQITQPDDVDFLIIPRVSSERRRYVPIGFLDADNISSDAVQIVPNASLYHFGVLTSNVHMAWMRLVAGRMKSDYRYSKEIVYNTFPWPEVTDKQKEKIQTTADAILKARAQYPDCSLSILYNEATMPVELRKAHQQNDRAVMEAYGFPCNSSFTESDCVTKLFKLYEKLTTKGKG